MIQICTPSSLSIAHALPAPSLLNHNPFLYLSSLPPLSLVNPQSIAITIICSFHTNRQYKKYYETTNTDTFGSCLPEKIQSKTCSRLLEPSAIGDFWSERETLERLPFHGTNIVSLLSSLLNSIVSTRSATSDSLSFFLSFVCMWRVEVNYCQYAAIMIQICTPSFLFIAHQVLPLF